jgi:uncharacterized membrane protein affecting hemolysin expression
MKKFLSLTAIAAIAFACFGCQNNKKNSDLENASQADSLQQIISQKDNEINDMMSTLNDIQEGFKEINEAEDRVTVAKEGNAGHGSPHSPRNSGCLLRV